MIQTYIKQLTKVFGKSTLVKRMNEGRKERG